jgi:hypothetical protein
MADTPTPLQNINNKSSTSVGDTSHVKFEGSNQIPATVEPDGPKYSAGNRGDKGSLATLCQVHDVLSRSLKTQNTLLKAFENSQKAQRDISRKHLHELQSMHFAQMAFNREFKESNSRLLKTMNSIGASLGSFAGGTVDFVKSGGASQGTLGKGLFGGILGMLFGGALGGDPSQAAWGGIGGAVGGMFGHPIIGALVGALGHQFLPKLLSGVKDVLGNVWDRVKTPLKSMFDTIKTNINKALFGKDGLWPKASKWMGEQLKKLPGALWKGFKGAVKWVWEEMPHGRAILIGMAAFFGVKGALKFLQVLPGLVTVVKGVSTGIKGIAGVLGFLKGGAAVAGGVGAAASGVGAGAAGVAGKTALIAGGGALATGAGLIGTAGIGLTAAGSAIINADKHAARRYQDWNQGNTGKMNDEMFQALLRVSSGRQRRELQKIHGSGGISPEGDAPDDGIMPVLRGGNGTQLGRAAREWEAIKGNKGRQRRWDTTWQNLIDREATNTRTANIGIFKSLLNGDNDAWMDNKKSSGIHFKENGSKPHWGRLDEILVDGNGNLVTDSMNDFQLKGNTIITREHLKSSSNTPRLAAEHIFAEFSLAGGTLTLETNHRGTWKLTRQLIDESKEIPIVTAGAPLEGAALERARALFAGKTPESVSAGGEYTGLYTEEASTTGSSGFLGSLSNFIGGVDSWLGELLGMGSGGIFGGMFGGGKGKGGESAQLDWRTKNQERFRGQLNNKLLSALDKTAEEYGKPLIVTSSFRSRQRQQDLINRITAGGPGTYIDQGGSYKALPGNTSGLGTVAKLGRSHHERGEAVDLAIPNIAWGNPAYKELQDIGKKHGLHSYGNTGHFDTRNMGDAEVSAEEVSYSGRMPIGDNPSVSSAGGAGDINNFNIANSSSGGDTGGSHFDPGLWTFFSGINIA